MLVSCVLLGGCGGGGSPQVVVGDDATGSTGTTGSVTTEMISTTSQGATSGDEPSTSGGVSESGETGENGSSTGVVERPPPEPDPIFGTFLWPVGAWISADEYYQTGLVHSGSADLSGPYWSAVGAARGGDVIAAEWSDIGGYLVRIDHGGGYSTLYSHLSESPLVAVGDVVEANELLGYLGRTGNAYRGGAHVHFSIDLDSQRQVIPSLEHATWVERGQPIPGTWAGLDEVVLPPQTFEVRVTADALPIHAGPSQGEDVVGELQADELVTVYGSSVGYYRIWHQNADGWIVHSGTVPAESGVFGVQVGGSAAPVTSEPGAGASVVGSVSSGSLVTVFEEAGGFYRVLYDLPTTYEWLDVADAEPTPRFSTRLRAPSANVRSGPGIEHDVIGSLGFFDEFIVEAEENGWYRVDLDGQQAWVAGWFTSGRL